MRSIKGPHSKLLTLPLKSRGKSGDPLPPGNVYVDLVLHDLEGSASDPIGTISERVGDGAWTAGGGVSKQDGGSGFGLVAQFDGLGGTFMDRDAEKVSSDENFKIAIICKPLDETPANDWLYDAANGGSGGRAIIQQTSGQAMALNTGFWDLSMGTATTGDWHLIVVDPVYGGNALLTIDGSQQVHSNITSIATLSIGTLGAARGGASFNGDFQIARLVIWDDRNTSDEEIRTWANARYGGIF